MDEKREPLPPLWPEIWADAIQTQCSRVLEAREALINLPSLGKTTQEEKHQDQMAVRLTWEAHFLVIAIRHLLRTHQAYLSRTGDHRLVSAGAEFEAAVPHAKDFRDFLEHIDLYLRDEGNLQKTGDVATGVDLVVHWGRRTGRVTLEFGDHLLDLRDATEAALALAEVSTEIWTEYVMKGMEDAGGAGIVPQ